MKLIVAGIKWKRTENDGYANYDEFMNDMGLPFTTEIEIDDARYTEMDDELDIFIEDMLLEKFGCEVEESGFTVLADNEKNRKYIGSVDFLRTVYAD